MGLSVEDILKLHDAEDIDLQEWLSGEGRPQIEVIHYTSHGWDIEGILVLPPGRTDDSPLPTLVYLHGGPERRNQVTFSDLASARGESAALFLASHGYAIFLPNFRGSSGYGDHFMNQLQDYHLMDNPFSDVMAGIDVLIDQGIADADRLAVYGSSYGAQLGAWAIAHTDRFHSAVLVIGRYDTLIHDRESGRSFHSLRPNRGAPSCALDMWLRPEVYDKISPMQHVTSMKTPSLIVETGAEHRDNQARTLFNALQAFGVDVWWVFYPEAFHNGRWSASYKRDYMSRLLAWFNHYLHGAELPSSFDQRIVSMAEELFVQLKEHEDWREALLLFMRYCIQEKDINRLGFAEGDRYFISPEGMHFVSVSISDSSPDIAVHLQEWSSSTRRLWGYDDNGELRLSNNASILLSQCRRSRP